MTKDTKGYNASSIQVLEGLEAVRKRPGMYIGSTDSRGLHHLVWEIVDNAIDEALGGYCNNIVVRLHSDNSIEIIDNGRGMPTGKHAKGVPTPQVIFNTLHAGGKFDSSGGYKVSGGLHGVGASVVNALSEWLEVTIHRDNRIYYQRFLNGGRDIEKVKWLGETKKNGSSVRFKPDSRVFMTTTFDYNTIASRLKESAYLIKDLEIVLIDARDEMKVPKSQVFHYANGICEFIKSLTAGKSVIHEPTYFVGESNGIMVEASFQFCNQTYNEHVLSFVNNIKTRDGGTHETGFKAALTRAFNDHARLKGILKDKDINLEGTDIREGIVAIISVRIAENLLQFEGQTKNKLGTVDARQAVENIIYEQTTFYLSEKGEIANTLLANSLRASKAREAARLAREKERMVKQKTSKPVNLLGKLVPVQTFNPQVNELFLVEGDSAGGSARQGRDRNFQAILPLRGKVINTEKAKIEEVLKNEEIVAMISAIGAGFGNEFDISKCNYNKIIIMTDADTDGAHIQVLLLTFFFRYMYELIEAGRIYIATPPLYKITYKNVVEYAWSDEELRQKVTNQKNVMIQRYKGLGEMNFDQLWETTMDPEHRTLIQVGIGEKWEADNRITTLMGDDVEPRREWIDNNVVFDYIDNFTLEGDGQDEQE